MELEVAPVLSGALLVELELTVVMLLLPSELVVAPEESVEPGVVSEPVLATVVPSPPLALHSPLEQVCRMQINNFLAFFM